MSVNRSPRSRKPHKPAEVNRIVYAGRVASFKMRQLPPENLMRRFVGSAVLFTLFISGLCFAFPFEKPTDANKPEQVASATSPNSIDPLARLARLNQRLSPSQPNALVGFVDMGGLPSDNL